MVRASVHEQVSKEVGQFQKLKYVRVPAEGMGRQAHCAIAARRASRHALPTPLRHAVPRVRAPARRQEAASAHGTGHVCGSRQRDRLARGVHPDRQGHKARDDEWVDEPPTATHAAWSTAAASARNATASAHTTALHSS
jgi:hypothetical protein